jgi:hypothetical protein
MRLFGKYLYDVSRRSARVLTSTMAHSDFTISITNDAVDVSFTPSTSKPRGKLYGLIFTVSMLVLMVCAVLFLPEKHGNPSMWHDLTRDPPGSFLFFIMIVMVPFIGLFSWQLFLYSRAAWASDETFHCDREGITIKRIPWLDFSNRTWCTYTYPLSEVSAIRFAVIASAKGRAFWGLRFRSRGRKWALPGLEAPEAKDILRGLKALGADVPEDPNLDKRSKETLEMRVGDTSWMDRSWMTQLSDVV